MIVRCTKKVLDQLDLRTSDLAVASPSAEDWYLNLFFLDRRKCLLLTHSATLFSVFYLAVRKADLRQLGPYLIDAITVALRDEDLPPDVFGDLDPTTVRIAKTADRSTLGVMNDMAIHVKYQVAATGDVEGCDPKEVGHHLRRIPYNRGGYLYPIELLKERLVKSR